MKLEEIKKIIHEAAVMLKESEPFSYHSGLCSNLSVIIKPKITDFEDRGKVDELIRSLMIKWPKFSGCPHYPVPHPIFEAIYAYNNCSLWDSRTKYGRDRWELLDFIVEETK
jgi:hypothetical protein